MSFALASSHVPPSARQQLLRVMVVDDSVVIRGMISRWIEAEPDMQVSASLRTGLDAINQLEMFQADTYDPRRIDTELGWARSFGFNAARVFLHEHWTLTRKIGLAAALLAALLVGLGAG